MPKPTATGLVVACHIKLHKGHAQKLLIINLRLLVKRSLIMLITDGCPRSLPKKRVQACFISMVFGTPPGPQASQQMAELYLDDIYILKYIDYMVFMSLDVINDQSGNAI
jgi:hypothetical protein